MNLLERYQQFWEVPEFPFEPHFSIETLKHRSELKRIADAYLISPESFRAKFAFTSTGFLPRPTGTVSANGFSGTFVMHQDSAPDEGPKIVAKFSGAGKIEITLLGFLNASNPDFQESFMFFMLAFLKFWSGCAVLICSPMVLYSIYKQDYHAVLSGIIFILIALFGMPYVFLHLTKNINVWTFKNYKRSLAKRFGGTLIDGRPNL